MSPLAKAAGFNPDDINIYIVNDSSINAFVMGGSNIFINTGLITKYNDPNVLAGVIAHELGHIAAGHLARSSEDMQKINNFTILSYLAGIAAAIASKGDAGYAILMGGNHLAQRLAVTHTRGQEESADKLALEYLLKTKNSPSGLLKLLNHFNKEEKSKEDPIDEYALTHPISQKRVNFIKSHLENFNSIKADLKYANRLRYVNAKLLAFLGRSDTTLPYFAAKNPFDGYARSVIYFKMGKLELSLKELDDLIKLEPNNGYFYELKGQILFENGLIKESIKAYHQSIKLLPNNNLAKIALAAAIIRLENSDVDLINLAIKNLNEAKIYEKNNSQIFEELSKAYGKIGDKGRSYLALAELNLLKQDDKKAKEFANLAIKNLDENDKPDQLKAKDILVFTKDDEKSLDDDKNSSKKHPSKQAKIH